MIDQTSMATAEGEVALVVLPNRSLTRSGIFWFVALQTAAMLAVACYSAVRGNVFAPFFAVVEAVLVAYCLRLVWQGGAAGEVISIGADAVEVLRVGAAPASAVRFERAWVRATLQPGTRRNGATRLLLGTPGRKVQIGAFLADDEREALARRLGKLLAGGVSTPPADGTID